MTLGDGFMQGVAELAYALLITDSPGSSPGTLPNINNTELPMSGGHYDYKQGEVALLAELIEHDLKRVGTANEWGDTFQPEPSTIAAMELACAMAESLSDLVHDIDWCLSGDTGDDTLRKDMAVWLDLWQKQLSKRMDACPRTPKAPL